jgi:four helix bundle protein
MSSGLRDLKVWQEAVALAGDVARAIHACSRRETRQLTDRILHVALDVAARIAEGYERTAQPERMQLYRQARAALAVLETLLAAARHAGLLPSPALAQLSSRAAVVGRLLASYLTLADRSDVG